MLRSCWFSMVSWLTARTRAGTSARSWASSPGMTPRRAPPGRRSGGARQPVLHDSSPLTSPTGTVRHARRVSSELMTAADARLERGGGMSGARAAGGDHRDADRVRDRAGDGQVVAPGGCRPGRSSSTKISPAPSSGTCQCTAYPTPPLLRHRPWVRVRVGPVDTRMANIRIAFSPNAQRPVGKLQLRRGVPAGKRMWAWDAEGRVRSR